MSAKPFEAFAAGRPFLQRRLRRCAAIGLFLTPLWLGTAGCSSGAIEEAEAVGESTQTLEEAGFGPFSPIPNGMFTSGPAITARGTTSFDVFARGGGNVIYGSYWSAPTGWLPWTALSGGTFDSKPSATSDGSRMFVAAKGFDHKIYVKPFQSNQWGNWASATATTFDTAPAIAYAPPYLYLFARRSDQTIYWSRNDISASYNTANWSAFSPIPGVTLGPPAAVYDGGNVRLVARHSDDQFYTLKRSGAGWTSWSLIPGKTFKSEPAISSWGAGHVDVFGKGDDDKIYFSSLESGGAWNGFRVIGQANGDAKFKSVPAVWSTQGAPDLIKVVVQDFDLQAYTSNYVQPTALCPDTPVALCTLGTWPNGTVKYFWAPDAEWLKGDANQQPVAMTAEEIGALKNEIRAGMARWETAASGVVRFQETGNHVVDRVKLLSCGPDGGGHAVGYRPEETVSELCVGNIDHELGHILGFKHHHARFDRDHYIRANIGLIGECGSDQFARCATEGGDDFGPYNYSSTMHYRPRDPHIERWNGEPICNAVDAIGACANEPLPPNDLVRPGDGAAAVELYRPASWGKFTRTVHHGHTTPYVATAQSPLRDNPTSDVRISSTGSPAVETWEGNSLSIYTRGSDGRIWKKSYDTGLSRWTSWIWSSDSPAGVGTASDPAVVSWGTGRSDLVVRQGSAVHIRTYANGAWGAWGSLGTPQSPAASAPAITTWGPNRLDVFVRGTDNKLYYKYCVAACMGNQGTWSAWGAVGAGTFRGKPAAVSRGNGLIDVFVHGMDGQLWSAQFNGSWTWYKVAVTGTLKWVANTTCPDCYSPAVGSRSATTLDVYIRGGDDKVWYASWTGGATWNNYIPLGGVLTSSPATVSQKRSSNRRDLIVMMAEEHENNSSYIGTWWKKG